MAVRPRTGRARCAGAAVADMDVRATIPWLPMGKAAQIFVGVPTSLVLATIASVIARGTRRPAGLVSVEVSPRRSFLRRGSRRPCRAYPRRRGPWFPT